MRETLGAMLADIVVGERQREGWLAWVCGNRWVTVREKGLKAERSLLGQLEKVKGIDGRFSIEYLQKRLEGLVNREFVILSAAVEPAIGRVLNGMLKLANACLPRRLVNVPVFGLKIFPDNMSVGVGNVEFYTFGNTEKLRWLTFVERDRTIFKGDGPPGGSEVWAKVEVEAAEDDDVHSQEVCVESVRQAMSALLLFVFAYLATEYLARAYPFMPPQLSIWQEPSTVDKCYVYERGDEGSYDAGAAGEFRAPPQKLSITEEVLQEYEKSGFRLLSDLIKRPITPLQRAIYDSLKLFWTAYTSPDPAVSYLNYVAMLEMLVMRPKERAIKYSMPLRISWLLGESDTPEKREEMRAELARLYDDRSLIAHGQMREVEDIAEKLLTLRAFAYLLIKRLAACKNYSVQEEIVRWVKAKVLGAPDPFDTPLAKPWAS